MGSRKLLNRAWIPDDRGGGRLQFDNGLCGTAQVEVWEITHDNRYRAGDLASAKPMVTNWNLDDWIPPIPTEKDRPAL